MRKLVEVLFTPAEQAALASRDLGGATCVVFDVLRATTSMVTALANGARSIVPVSEIAEALAIKSNLPDVLLAGERNGFRITSALTGSIDFDLGNSPREFTKERVAGRSIVVTTTNGTRALRACRGAGAILVASLLNIDAVAEAIRARSPESLLIVCGGTHEEAAYEDTLGAGALLESLWSGISENAAADSTHIARQIFLERRCDLLGAMRFARNGRRLLAAPELRDDVAFCLEMNRYSIAPSLAPSGEITA